jgi:endonuclease YncB( thermonuclease family)
MHSKSLTAITALLLILLLPLAFAQTISFDKTAVVSSVIDGSSFMLNTVETIKLAAIDTPLSGQNGFNESRNYLASLVERKTVYLTVDTVTITEAGKLLCVAYLDYNSTHYININKAMIDNHYAIQNNTSNTKFNPAEWTFFVYKQTATPTPSEPTPINTPTATPTPTPFSGVSPSVSPEISAIPSTTQTAKPFDPPLTSAIIGLAAIAVIVVILAIVFLKRRK